MVDTPRAGLFRRFITALTAFGLLTSSIAPASAQSFGDILGSNNSSSEARARRMTPARTADAQAAKALFAKIGVAADATATLPPKHSTEAYDPRNARRAAELKAELASALDSYDEATVAEDRVGTPVDPLILARLRDAVAPFVRFLDALQQAQGVKSVRTMDIAPGEVRSFDLSAYCMDSNLPAPGSNETFRLIPASQMLPPDLAPLFAAMMGRPGAHEAETQGLVWALRNAHRHGKTVSLSADALQRLDATHPGAADAIGRYNRRIGNVKAVRGLIDAVLPGARSLVSQVEALDPRRMVEDTRAQLAALERMPVTGDIDQDAAYTTIAPGVAARSTSPWGGASRARIEIANTTSDTYRFVPAQWVATSPRSTQHLALQLPEGYSNENTAGAVFQLPIAELLSAGLDFTVLGNIKAVIQALTGYDLVTGEETSRWIELASIIPVVGQLSRGQRFLTRATNTSGLTQTFGPPSLTLARDTSWFWSGLGHEGDRVAANLARSRSGSTLEMTLEKRAVGMPTWDASNPASVAAWENASRIFAQNVSGDVRAVLGERLRPGNIWENVEVPRLKANPNVTRIIRVDPTTGMETIVWTR